MSKANWRMQLNESRELKKQGVKLLHARMVIYCRLYESEEFRAWCQDEDTDAATQLNDELSDTAFEFHTLARVLREYPDEKTWCTRDLRKIVASLVVKDEEAAGPKRTTISWKDRAMELERELARVREENERLRARIADLEQILGIGCRQPVGAR